MTSPRHCPRCGTAVDSATDDGAACPTCGQGLPGPGSGVTEGTVLGGFRIVRRLGGGGMGEVFLATQLALDRTVALKVLPPAITRDPELVADFQHEMRNLAKLDHPNVATAFTAGEDAGIHFLAMAYVDGEDLAARLEREGALPEDEALDCVLDVAEALKHAWDRFHLLHRDIKPGNIMIDREGVVKLMDMGLSKTLYEDLGATLAGTIVGTPHYMSPEQARGESGLSVASDIYALGVTLHHLLTGCLPFDAETPEEVLEAALTQDLPLATELRPDLSTATGDLVIRMTAKNAAERYGDWDAVIADIRRARGPRSGTAPVRQVRVHTGDVAASQARERVRRKKAGRRKAMMTSLAALVVAAGVGGGVVYLRKAQQRADAALARASAAEEEQTSAEERAARLEAEAEVKTVEAAIARALVNPDEEAALTELRALRETLDEPGLARAVTEATWRLETRKREETLEVLSELQARADGLLAVRAYDEAVSVFTDYTGPHADATREERTARAQAMSAAATRDMEMLRARSVGRLEEVKATVTRDLLNGRTDAAATIEAMLEEELTPGVEAQGRELLEVVRAIQRMPALVLRAYRKYLGRETTVYFVDGKQRVEILEVTDDKVKTVIHDPGGDVTRDFGIGDLGLREKVVRLGRTRRADLDMIRGLLAFQGGREESARRYLQLADHELAALLLVTMEQQTGKDEPDEQGERTSS